MTKNAKHGAMNCWEFMKCGRIPGGDKVVELGVCPAYPDNGRFCWSVAGTLCTGKVSGSFVEKKHTCLLCDFYVKVSSEEGKDFIFLSLNE
jgi:hypothetical protein